MTNGKIRYTYRGYTASDLKARASVPLAANISVGSGNIDCTHINTAIIRALLGGTRNSIAAFHKSLNLNKWSGFGPYTRSVSGTPDIRGNGAFLTHIRPIDHFKLGDFAGYNHSAPVPAYNNSNRTALLLITSGGTGIFDCDITLGELPLMNGDIIGHSQVLGIAFIVWDGSTLIGYDVKSLASLKDSVSFQVTKTNVTASRKYTCQVRLIDSASAYNYNPTNVICGIAELPDYEKAVAVQSANHFYFNAPYSSNPPSIVGSTYTFGDWVMGMPSFNIASGSLALQYISEAVRSWTGLHITAYVEEGYYDETGSWVGTIVTDETLPSLLWDGNWNTHSAVGNRSLVIWKSGGVTKPLPVPYFGYGHRIVIKCNPNQ